MLITTCKNFTQKTFEQIGYGCIAISKKINSSAHKQNFQRWTAVQGDKTHRLEYNLNEDSIVFDVGGYEGQWASDIYAKFNCTIHIFEPIAKFAENIRLRFKKNHKIMVHQCGLSNINDQTFISLASNASSIFTNNKLQEKITLVKFSDFVQKYKITHVDLMKINIEGGEYDLLEHIVESGIIKSITNIQVQFHDFVPQAEARMLTIQDSLLKTHRLTYQYPFIWESWEKIG